MLARGITPSAYAAHLLEIARAVQGRRIVPAGIAMLRSSRLGTRIAALLDPRRNRHATSRWVLLATVLVAVPVLVTLAIAQGTDGNEKPPAFPPITLPANVSPDQVVVSPDGRHVAFVESVEGQQVVVLDGKRGMPYGQIRAPWRTSDSVHGETFPGLFFSSDGERLAFAVKDGDGWAMVVDGKKGKTYEDLDIPIFSPDGRSVAYVARRDGEYRVVRDGEEGAAYSSVGTGAGYAYESGLVRPRFSADGTHLVFLARKKTGNTYQNYFVTDGKETPRDGWITGLTFPEKGPRMAYRIGRQGGLVAVIDGKAHPEYGSAEAIAFSPDGRRVAVVASDGRESPYRLFIDGKDIVKAEKIHNPKFSPDGNRISYIIQKAKDDIGLVVDDAYYSFTIPPVFSPDSQHFAAMQQLSAMEKHTTKTIDWKACVLRDGKPGPTVRAVYEICFSPDSRHLVYRALIDEQHVLMVDDQVRPIQGQLLSARKPGVSGPGETRSFFFDAPDRFHYFAVKDGKVVRVEKRIAEAPAAATTMAPAAGGGDARLSMRLIPLPGNAEISAYEPVVMLLQTTNVSKEQVSLPAWTTQYTMQIDIRDEKRKVVASLPKLPIPLDFLYTSKTLQPRETLESTLIFSSLYTFATPGVYTIELLQFDIGFEKQKLLATATAKVTVQAFDEARLQARIDRHMTLIRQHDPGLGLQAKILYSVRHNLVLPALEWMTREWDDRYAARGIRRIGTPEATALLKKLDAEGGNTAKAVRESANLHLHVDMWDIGGDDSRVLPAKTLPASRAVGMGPVLALIDGPTEKVLFTLDDIVRFDWDRQVFQLTREKAMDLLALQVLTREFRLAKEKQIIYTGAFYSPISSNLPKGPMIVLGSMAEAGAQIRPPLFEIQAGAEVSRGKPDSRFSPALRNVLAAAGKLGAIDPAAVPPIAHPGTSWQGDRELKVRAVVFPETFRIGQPARVHMFFNPADITFDTDGIELQARITAADGTFSKAVYRYKVPLHEIRKEGCVIFRLPGWWEANRAGAITRATPGPAQVRINAVAIKDEIRANGEYHPRPIRRVELPAVAVEILPEKE